MKNGTWLESEERCYPSGGFLRKGRAVLKRNVHNPIDLPYGKIRSVRASVSDTFFSISAKIRYYGLTVKGFLTYDEETGYEFTPNASPENCTVCETAHGCKHE